ncbi:aldo/keto reductase family protein [Tribonema minus]|uniref:Aldo/keto reductase family protein n=1 Tax=Tribonema minus TaxID=303371 RepID=A0A836CJF6_9STRA|nr:aldo/keto reductase family protein [Tribonema minus]
MVGDAPQRVDIGGVSVAPLGVGTWAWGDTLMWSYSEAMDNELQEAFDVCVSKGINLFDTAEIYGFGRSEYLCGKFKRDFAGPKEQKDDIAIASKFAPVPLPTRLTRKSVVATCKNSLDRMGLQSMELYQLHWPAALLNKAYWDGLADCHEQGLVKAIGVSNYGPELLQKAHDALNARGVPLATNQIQYSLLSRKPEMSGLLDKCSSLGVKVLAYSPLAQGLLTGKYSEANLPSGPRERMYKSMMPKITPLIATLTQIAQEREKTLSQVALNWCIAKGTIPIPGAKNVRQAEENAGALGWQLSPEEVFMLDEASDRAGVSTQSMPLAS